MTGSLPVAAALAVAVVVGLLWALWTPWILRRLPEPAPAAGDTTGTESGADDVDEKIPYAALATRGFAASVGALTLVAMALPALTLPAALVPPWLVLATLGVLLAAIDARTTWLPLPLTRLAWIAMAGAVAAAGLLGAWSAALRGVIGFGLAGAVFGAIWLLTRGGFGFGDVRYAPLVGAATAGVSWTVLAWALVLGSLVGALVGLARLAGRRRGPFAYAPSILAGGYLAVALCWLTT